MKILFRGACLSRNTFDNIVEDFELVSCNKQRVDYALETICSPGAAVSVKALKSVIPMDEMLEAQIRAQERSIFSYDDVRAIVMDSYSELVDVRFVHENSGTRFFATYSDVKRTPGLLEMLRSDGRLDLSGLRAHYDEFFRQVERVYGDIPVLYLVFPSDFEDREEFLVRHVAVEAAIREVAAGRRNVTVFKPGLVEKNPNDEMTYHFSYATYLSFARQICAKVPWLKLKRRTMVQRIYERKKYADGWRRITVLSFLNVAYRRHCGIRKAWLGPPDRYAFY